MKKTSFLISIVLILVLTCMACSSNKTVNTVNGGTDTKNESYVEAENVLKGYLTALLTVKQSDYDYYEKMTGIAKPGLDLNSMDALYKKNTGIFSEYLVNRLYEDFYARRLSYFRIDKAYKNNYFVEIKNLALKKTGEDKDNKTVTYTFNMQLNQIDKNTGSVKAAYDNGYSTLINDNGKWLINSGIGM